jgi:hypothetical protein
MAGRAGWSAVRRTYRESVARFAIGCYLL